MKTIRAVAIVIHQDRILLMHRWVPEKEYFVFPGGHVESRESVTNAVIREVREEASLKVTVEKLLYHYLYDDGTERFYYLCTYISGIPKLGDGPEAERMNASNRYRPEWVETDALPQLLLYPLETRDWLIEDIRTRFASTPKETTLKIAELRQTLS